MRVYPIANSLDFARRIDSSQFDGMAETASMLLVRRTVATVYTVKYRTEGQFGTMHRV